jgi:AraC-like DNA-binding protein
MNNIQHIRLSLKNFHCDCCHRLLRLSVQNQKFKVKNIYENQVEISFNPTVIKFGEIKKFFEELGFPPLQSKDLELLEKLKIAIHELIFEMNNADSIIQKSEYLVAKTGVSFGSLSKLFSQYENCTLERYIIKQKIEKIKSMILEDEYTLSEIAYLMDYSSVHYLSNLFKKETGYTFTEFKNKYIE